MVLYAPAICPDCGGIFRSDLPIAEAAWMIPSYRSTGGRCPRCAGRGAVPSWVYLYRDIAAQCCADASDREKRSLATSLTQLLRRHRTAKQTLTFINDLRGPWKPLVRPSKAMSPPHRRAQLTFLLWMLTESEGSDGATTK